MKATAFEVLESKVSLVLFRLTVQAQTDLARTGSSREEDILMKRSPSCLLVACLPRLRCSRVWLADIANASVDSTGPWRRSSTFSTTQIAIVSLIAAMEQVGGLPEDITTENVLLEEHMLMYLCTLRPQDNAEPIMWRWRMPPASALPPEVLDLARAAVQSHLGHALRSSRDVQMVRSQGTETLLHLPGYSASIRYICTQRDF